jgi:hypothetical protein
MHANNLTMAVDAKQTMDHLMTEVHYIYMALCLQGSGRTLLAPRKVTIMHYGRLSSITVMHYSRWLAGWRIAPTIGDRQCSANFKLRHKPLTRYRILLPPTLTFTTGLDGGI